MKTPTSYTPRLCASCGESVIDDRSVSGFVYCDSWFCPLFICSLEEQAENAAMLADSVLFCSAAPQADKSLGVPLEAPVCGHALHPFHCPVFPCIHGGDCPSFEAFQPVSV